MSLVALDVRLKVYRHKGRQGNFCTISSVISDEYKDVFKKSINTESEYETVPKRDTEVL